MKVKPHESLCGCHDGYVTSKTLLLHNLLNGSWVRVQNVEERLPWTSSETLVADNFKLDEAYKDCFVVRLAVIDGDKLDLLGCEDDVLHVSPLSAVNIWLRSEKPVVECSTANVKLHALQRFSTDNVRDLALQADISPIACPVLCKDTFDDDVKAFFKSPVLLSPKEIFSIPIGGQPSYCARDMWFRCNGLTKNASEVHDSNSAWVCASTTNLYLSGPVNAFLPDCVCLGASNRGLMQLINSEDYLAAFQAPLRKLFGFLSLLLKGAPSAQVSTIIIGDRGVGKGLLVRKACAAFGFHLVEENAYELNGESLAATEQRLENMFARARSSSPCVLLVRNSEMLGKDKEGVHDEPRLIQSFVTMLETLVSPYPVMVIGTTSDPGQFAVKLASAFLYKIELAPPSEAERQLLLQALFREACVNGDVSVPSLAKTTAGMVLGDLIAVVKYAIGKAPLASTTLAGNDRSRHLITNSALISSVDCVRRTKSSSASSVHIPSVTWDDVGGLAQAKADIVDTIQLPLLHPHLFKSGLRRSGLLFYGPPGCGKTLLAKAVATEFSLNFFSVKGPELINMYVGQSEENIRAVFAKARHVAPCVVFFDELDSIAPSRGRSGDAGGVMDRVVSQLLAELDGMHDNTNVFVIGATNRPDLLDSALLRPGRFDKLIYVGVSESRDERLKLLRAVTRKLVLGDDVSLDVVLARCPENMTGADFYALAADATMQCLRRQISKHEEEKVSLDCCEIVVTQHDFMTAVKNLVPSISVEELNRYKEIKADLLAQRM